MDITKVGDHKINETQISQNQEAQKASIAKKVGVSAEKAKEAQKTIPSKYLDKIEFSGDAIAASEGVEAAKTAPDIRAEKVAALKAAVKNGTYKTDAKQIADSMIQKSFEESLLTRKG